MIMRIEKSLSISGFISLLALTGCGNKGPLYQTPVEQAEQTPKAGEQDMTKQPEQEQ